MAGDAEEAETFDRRQNAHDQECAERDGSRQAQAHGIRPGRRGVVVGMLNNPDGIHARDIHTYWDAGRLQRFQPV